MTGRRSHGRLSALNGVVHQGTPTLNAYPERFVRTGAIHLAHAAFADLGSDVVGAEGSAGLEWHDLWVRLSATKLSLQLGDEPSNARYRQPTRPPGFHTCRATNSHNCSSRP